MLYKMIYISEFTRYVVDWIISNHIVNPIGDVSKRNVHLTQTRRRLKTKWQRRVYFCLMRFGSVDTFCWSHFICGPHLFNFPVFVVCTMHTEPKFTAWTLQLNSGLTTSLSYSSQIFIHMYSDNDFLVSLCDSLIPCRVRMMLFKSPCRRVNWDAHCSSFC